MVFVKTADETKIFLKLVIITLMLVKYFLVYELYCEALYLRPGLCMSLLLRKNVVVNCYAGFTFSYKFMYYEFLPTQLLHSPVIFSGYGCTMHTPGRRISQENSLEVVD